MNTGPQKLFIYLTNAKYALDNFTSNKRKKNKKKILKQGGIPIKKILKQRLCVDNMFRKIRRKS